MGRLLNTLFNATFVLTSVAVMVILFMGLAIKSFGGTINKPAIYYPHAPEIKVMEIDTGVDFNIDDLGVHIPDKYHSIEYMDHHGHGTHVAGIILKNTCLNVKLIPCKFWDGMDDKSDQTAREIACLKQAYREKVDVVNFSAGGQFPNKSELRILRKMGKRNIVVVVAAGNNGHKLTISNNVDKVNKYLDNCNDAQPCKDQKFYYYPASYSLKNLIRVASYRDGERAKSSNYADGFWEADGEDVTSYAPGGSTREMTGTSQSAASATNKILIDMCNLDK